MPACAACHQDRDPGELLRVSDLWGRRPDAVVCRPTVAPACLGWAGPAGRTALALLDPADARRVDAGGRDPIRRAEVDALALNAGRW